MLGRRIVIKRGSKDEAEKPFWISFSDMMTALMVLFLVVMAVALLAIPKKVLQAEDGSKKHQQAIAAFMRELREDAKNYPGVVVDVDRRVINYGARAHFAVDDWRLGSDQEDVVRGFTPVILHQADSADGRVLLKQVIVEGYTDRTGSYLHNLNLSLKRSQRVLCALFADTGQNLLNGVQKERVRRLFMVGGYSLNDAKSSPEESRRVEMQLQFYDYNEYPEEPTVGQVEIGKCEV